MNSLHVFAIWKKDNLVFRGLIWEICSQGFLSRQEFFVCSRIRPWEVMTMATEQPDPASWG